MLNKMIVASISFAFCFSAFARPEPDRLGICYKMQGADEVLKKGMCIVSSGYGAGSGYIDLDWGLEQYHIEYTSSVKGYEESSKLNGRKSTWYFRSARFFDEQDYDDIESSADTALTCYRNKETDICFN